VDSCTELSTVGDWKAFTAAGFAVVGFEEPRVTEDRHHLAENETKLLG
jgi:hypothetical protein